MLLPLWERQVASSHRRRVPPPGRPNVAIITAMPPDACRHVRALTQLPHDAASEVRSRPAVWRLRTVQIGPWMPAVWVFICRHVACSFPIADHFNSLGVINKQDYARRHGWELHLSAENVDPTAVVSLSAVTALALRLHRGSN